MSDLHSMTTICACRSADAHNCWSLRYHGHTGVSELTVHNEGGPCECSCHDEDSHSPHECSDTHGNGGATNG